MSQRNPAAEIATQAGFGAGYVSDRDAGQGLCAVERERNGVGRGEEIG